MKHELPLLLMICFLLLSCNKIEPEPNNTDTSLFKNGLLVLNEGLFQQNNASLSWIDLATNEVTNQLFLEVNERPLGDTGNDMIAYGSKIYIIVNGSSTLEIVEKSTLKSIKQVQLQQNEQGQQPRSACSYQGKVYISSYDGFVNILDTNSLSITQRIQVGRNPEGIDVVNGKLYVANSGGLSFPNVDSTVFEIDLTTHEIVDTFFVGENPGNLTTDNDGDIYVVKRGDYSENNPSELIRISNNGNVENLGIPATSLSKKGDLLYISYYDFNSGESNAAVFDMNSETILSTELLNDGAVETLYGIQPWNEGTFFVFDAMNFTNTGYVKSFDGNGALLNTFHVGLNPTKIVIYE
jgi:DNA-binding beta-propeller fold protein YncE